MAARISSTTHTVFYLERTFNTLFACFVVDGQLEGNKQRKEEDDQEERFVASSFPKSHC